MSDIVWEPEWRHFGMPEIGDYVQLRSEHEVTGDLRTEEGFVVAMVLEDDGVVYLRLHTDPAVKPQDERWWIHCWRLGALPEYVSVHRSRDILAEVPA